MDNIYKKRRSIYPIKFNDTPIDDNLIKELLEAANWAPSHKKTEPWRFYVIKNKLPEFSKFLKDKYIIHSPNATENKLNKIEKNIQLSSHVIAICMQRDPQERVPEWEEIAATAMAVQNMWLKATDLNLGGYWSSPSVILSYLHEFLPMASGEKCLGFFYIGNFDGDYPKGKRNPIGEKTTWL